MGVLADSAARKLLHGAGARGLAADGISYGLDGLWQLIAGLIHLLALPFQSLAATIVHGIEEAVAGVLAGIGSVAHLFVLAPFEAFWQWIRDASAAALPYVQAIVAVVCVVALAWLAWTFLLSAAVVICPPLAAAAVACWAVLFPVAVRVGQAVVVVVCYTAKGIGVALARFLPICGRCCVVVTIKGPGAAGMVISRGAFEALPRL
uniref:Uncharacterized protein n=1 Tax=Leersia perrieri TaxID=77586 RepID=A0A0D9V0I3_9ORYZ